MPPELILPWESEEQIIEQELPDYRKLGWHVEDWPAGLLLIGPHRIPELLDPGQLLHPLESEPGIPEPEPDMPAIVVVDGVVLVAPRRRRPRICLTPCLEVACGATQPGL